MNNIFLSINIKDINKIIFVIQIKVDLVEIKKENIFYYLFKSILKKKFFNNI